MVLLALATLICSHLQGGSKPETRSILAQATANRNPGLALLLMTLNLPNLGLIKGGMISSVLVYSLVVAIATATYVAWCKRKKNFSLNR